MSSDLDPRSVLPYSDDEIRELYLAASARGDREAQIARAASRSLLTIADVVLVTLLLYGLVFALFWRLFGVEAALWTSATTFVFAAWFMNDRAKRHPVGALSAWAWTRARRDRQRRDAAVDPYQPDVLRVVVDYLADGPTTHARELMEKISGDLLNVEKSLDELEQLCVTLRYEIHASRDEAVNMLLESKHSAAVETMRHLLGLKTELAGQADAANEAVRPVAELRAKFDRLQSLSDSLGRIQAAHGIAEQTADRIQEHRLELSLLRSVSAAATIRLQEIQSVVENHERAEVEVAQL